MARPRKEGLDYFPHDTDAASDEKIEALTIIYGAKGYAFYFILLACVACVVEHCLFCIFQHLARTKM